MAAAAAGRDRNLHKTGIFWKNDDSDEEGSLAFVPGLSGGAPFVSGLRHSNPKGRRRGESAGPRPVCKRSARQRERESSAGSGSGTLTVAPEEQTATGNAAFPPGPQMDRDQSQVCLKDLCPEDKRRIADLIQELARVSEEQESSALRFRDEQGQYEQKILELEEQNVLIAQERESLQQQYKECQELLGLYQLHLRQQREPLDTHRRQASEETWLSAYLSGAKAGGALFDGSYLALVPPQGTHLQPLRPTVPPPGPPPAHEPHGPPPQAPHCPPSLQNDLGLCRRCQGSERGHQSHTKAQPSAHRSEDRPPAPSEEQRRTSPVLRSEDREQRRTSPVLRSEDREQRRTSPVLRSEDWEQRRTSPVLRSEDWDQRRNQLMVQKQQLEQERERLQRRLSEQEQRMSWQQGLHGNGELGHTQQSSAPEHGRSSRDGTNKRDIGTSPMTSSNLHQPNEQTRSRTESEAEARSRAEAEARSRTQSEAKARSRTEAEARSRTEAEARSRSGSESLSRSQCSPEPRLELSLSELLQIFSPVCPSTNQRSATLRTKEAQRPGHRSIRDPAPRSVRSPAPQDPEESRILEDIFFIC